MAVSLLVRNVVKVLPRGQPSSLLGSVFRVRAASCNGVQSFSSFGSSVKIFWVQPSRTSFSQRFLHTTRRLAAEASSTSGATAANAAADATLLPVLPGQRAMGIWLLGCSALVFGTVVLGGVTRLTESGLSIVDWSPIRGIKAPSTEAEWQEQFDNYKQFPEFKYVNKNMTLEDFKRIFYMEYYHRIAGRLVGVAYVLPLAYFWARGYVQKKHIGHLFGLGAGIGVQGIIGWLMVKSGLDHDPQGAHVPRVHHTRLMLHLGTAFALYAGMLSTGLKYIYPNPPAIHAQGATLLRRFARGNALLVFITAMTGALVAGLDAGLVYNEFPFMGTGLVPSDLLALSPPLRNFVDNPSAVQFVHRCMGIGTATSIVGLWALSRGVALPPSARRAVNALLAMAAAQVTLGISTLLYFVPTSLAATHQAGSLTLLTFAMWFAHELRRIVK